jgi:hypothetical protein
MPFVWVAYKTIAEAKTVGLAWMDTMGLQQLRVADS